MKGFVQGIGSFAGKMKDTLLGRAVGILIADGSEGGAIKKIKNAAIEFVHDAYGHLKAIAVDQGGQTLLKSANIGQDAGVVDADDKDAFIAVAKTRQWEREISVRTLA
jgi:catalase